MTAGTGDARTTTVSRHLAAPPEVVWAALVDPSSVERWRVPTTMTCRVHELDAREGGRVRVSLTYEGPDGRGKTTDHTDAYTGRFVRVVRPELLVEEDEFDTADPAMRGTMTSTIMLRPAAGGGTELVAVHEGIPPGVRLEDNEQGWNEALDRLSALVAAPGSTTGA